ncbi:xanthine dehydrogenase family protein molybdopterin-binding subunit [Streptomyces lycii]|nr:xanthine dehydrogenase family protein molybdopterin-binding subunit [Streptomyces lycii]
MTMSKVVGKPLRRVDARAKVTGAAQYAADARVPGAAHGFLVMSTVARGRISRIDVRAAEAAPGVLAVLTHRTMPRLRTPPGEVPYFKSFVPLQDDRIHHAGQPVALVVAGTLEQAQEAATLVEVRYDSERPRAALLDALDEAYVPPDSHDEPSEYTRGDVAAGREQAEVTVDVTYTTVTQHHNPMEPSVTLAVWDGADLTVHESAQGIGFTRSTLAEALDVPPRNVRVLSPYLGGGFGGKGPVWPHTLLTAAAAREVGRPVKLVLSRAHTYSSTGHRAETHQRLALGARRDGRLTFAEHTTTEQVSRTEQSLHAANKATRLLYGIPNLRTVQRAVRLDLPTGSFMRSPEATTSHVLECALDELSCELGVDPVELRLRNDTRVDLVTGEPFGSRYLAECFRRGAELFGWDRRDPEPRSMRDEDGLVGWGVAAAAHTGGGFPGGAARVTLSEDGTALVQSGTQDIGTGTYTVMTQVSADGLGVPTDAVRFELGDTRFPGAPLSAGSATVPCTVPGVFAACATARDTVVGMAVRDPESPLHGRDPGRITVRDGRLFVTGDPGRYDTYRAVVRRHGEPVVVNSPPQDSFSGYSTGAVFAEVCVHPRLGTVRVRRVTGVFDPGTVLNHRTARSQAIGGAIWNIGFTLTEHTLIDAHAGRVVNPNLSGYLVPVNADVPRVEVEFIDKPDPTSPALNARGFGETPSTGVTAALANAVYHATGRRIRELPLTPDKLL